MFDLEYSFFVWCLIELDQLKLAGIYIALCAVILLLSLTAGIALPIVACSTKKQTSLEPVVVETLISAFQSWNGDFFSYQTGQTEMKLEKINAHYCQIIGDEEMVVFSASAGSKGKKTTIPTE